MELRDPGESSRRGTRHHLPRPPPLARLTLTPYPILSSALLAGQPFACGALPWPRAGLVAQALKAADHQQDQAQGERGWGAGPGAAGAEADIFSQRKEHLIGNEHLI